MHRGRERAERLVGANVRSGLFAADVLLAGGERQNEAAAALHVNGLAGEAAGHLANVFLARGDHANERSAVARSQAETLALHRDDVRLGGRTHRAQRDSFGDSHDQQRFFRMRNFSERRDFFQHAEEIRRLDDDRCNLTAYSGAERSGVQLSRSGECNLLDLQSGIPRVGGEHLAVFRVHRARYQHAAAVGDPLRHQRRFGERRRTVVHRGVGDFLASELAHQRLEFEDGLQRALADLRLVRRVRSKEFAALEKRVGDDGAVMVVNACAEKARIADRILRCARFEEFDDLHLRERPGQTQRRLQTVCGGNGCKQLFDGLRADGCQHLLAFRGALREVAHQAEASFCFSAMYFWYAAASISEDSSPGFESLTLMSHAAPCGSLFNCSGELARAELTATTSPETGA